MTAPLTDFLERTADEMERTGKMPKADLFFRARGLCAVFNLLYEQDKITERDCFNLKVLLFKMNAHIHMAGYGSYYWPPGEVAPRIAALRAMAERLKDKEI